MGILAKVEPDIQRASVIRATTDSPMSPPPLTSIATPLLKNVLTRPGGIYSTPRTLYDIFTAQDKSKHRPDFAGRTNDNSIAKLYPNLKLDNDRGPRADPMEAE